jgi:broad specificity polyphosphatase/5'/3'-nucleotidase SurE
MAEGKRLNILLTNDDGIYADGLWALYHTLVARHNVVVVAPDRERSAVGHGITLDHPFGPLMLRSMGAARAGLFPAPLRTVSNWQLWNCSKSGPIW